jgi:hypothetical protein
MGKIISLEHERLARELRAAFRAQLESQRAALVEA